MILKLKRWSVPLGSRTRGMAVCQTTVTESK